MIPENTGPIPYCCNANEKLKHTSTIPTNTVLYSVHKIYHMITNLQATPVLI